MDPIVLDVRGEICPGPLLKTREAMDAAAGGQAVEVLTDFLPAVLNLTNAAMKLGWDIRVRRIAAGEWRVELARSEPAA